ncbi:MAG TPA: hypothetical protein VFH40_10060 [Gemmatimonadales bacterium]|nr:hypothetical protein [Gemmatimonadales bacterium]
MGIWVLEKASRRRLSRGRYHRASSPGWRKDQRTDAGFDSGRTGYNPRPFTFVAGQTVRVRLKFVNSQGEDLDIVESEHCAGLTFDPGSLATATRLSTNHYQLDVTGQAPGSGTLQVSFGHDELADEHTFPEGAVTVTP